MPKASTIPVCILYNDRLLLGLQGTLSEAELHMLHQRLNAGRLSKV